MGMNATIKIGCCVDLDAVTNGTAVALREAGYDYLELPLAGLTHLDKDEASALAASIRQAQITVGACNLFFPGGIKLTGPDADPESIAVYVDKALARAASFGIPVLVVGSGGARNVPEGFPKDRAWAQLTDVFRLIGGKAAAYDIAIAIEPLNRKESNIINTLAEGKALAVAAGGGPVGLLADYYHMAAEGEAADFDAYRDILKHTHYADPGVRTFPKDPDAGLAAFVDGLRRVDYAGGISMECSSHNRLPEATAALTVAKGL